MAGKGTGGDYNYDKMGGATYTTVTTYRGDRGRVNGTPIPYEIQGMIVMSLIWQGN